MNNLIAAELFIQELQEVIKNNRLVFDPRNGKTNEFMLEEGLTVEDVFLILESLSPKNYYDGPKNDRNGKPGIVMMFLFPYKENRRIYIKLKIWKDRSGKAGVIISFHEEGNYD